MRQENGGRDTACSPHYSCLHTTVWLEHPKNQEQLINNIHNTQERGKKGPWGVEQEGKFEILQSQIWNSLTYLCLIKSSPNPDNEVRSAAAPLLAGCAAAAPRCGVECCYLAGE